MVYMLGYKCPWSQLPSMKFLDGDPFKVSLIDPTPEPGLDVHTRQQALLGRPIRPDHVPTTLLWKSRHEMPDFEGPLGFLCVSSRMKEIIEGFEPDVHQFFPIKVVDEAGEQIAERFLWVVCNLVDSVDREHTTFKLMHGRTWMSNYLENGERVRIPNARLVYSEKQTEGYHFWRDGHLMGGGLYASNEAGNALLNAGLTALVGSRQETV